jgi:cytochrome c peroxidase
MRKTLLLSLALLGAGACGSDPALTGSAGSTGSAGASPDAGTMDAWPLDPATGLRVPAIPPVPALPEWADNPSSADKLALGQALFFDARLSGSGTHACISCHAPTSSFQAATVVDLPDRSYPDFSPSLDRNTPVLLNLVYAPVFRWDGSYSTTLDAVLALPLAEANMNTQSYPDRKDIEHIDIPATQIALQTKLTKTAPGYVAAFKKAFGVQLDTMKPEEVWKVFGQALASYMRVVVSKDSKFDQWNTGKLATIEPAVLRGLDVFLHRGGCVICHSGPMLSDFQFHNISSSVPGTDGKRPDDGRFRVTGKEEDRGKFLTPMLRTAEASSPYLHNGSFISISEVIAYKMSLKGRVDPLHDPILDTIDPLDHDQVADVVEFLKALRGQQLAKELLLTPPFP